LPSCGFLRADGGRGLGGSVRSNCEHLFALAHPPYIREKARELRVKKKLTIDEIAAHLALSRTTIYYWVRDIPIPRPGGANGWPGGARGKGNRAMQRKYRLIRERAYRQGHDEYAALASLPTFRDFVCMYVGEGYKRSRNTVALGNSDPRVVRLADRWMRQFSRNPVTYAFQYHADQNPDYLKGFWAFGLGVDPSLIRYQRKSNSGQLSGRTWRSKYGVLTVNAHDTCFRMRLQAWMDRLYDEWVDSSLHGA